MQLFENGNYMFWLYVGCAYGLVAGVSGRVGNHEDPEHRAKHGSYHYKTMEQPGVQSNFLLLVRFASKVHPVVVFLAESAMALLFGAYLPKSQMGRGRSEQSFTQIGTPYQEEGQRDPG